MTNSIVFAALDRYRQVRDNGASSAELLDAFSKVMDDIEGIEVSENAKTMVIAVYDEMVMRVELMAELETKENHRERVEQMSRITTSMKYANRYVQALLDKTKYMDTHDITAELNRRAEIRQNSWWSTE